MLKRHEIVRLSRIQDGIVAGPHFQSKGSFTLSDDNGNDIVANKWV